MHPNQNPKQRVLSACYILWVIYFIAETVTKKEPGDNSREKLVDWKLVTWRRIINSWNTSFPVYNIQQMVEGKSCWRIVVLDNSITEAGLSSCVAVTYIYILKHYNWGYHWWRMCDANMFVWKHHDHEHCVVIMSRWHALHIRTLQ
jgi:hypothetical protein